MGLELKIISYKSMEIIMMKTILMLLCGSFENSLNIGKTRPVTECDNSLPDDKFLDWSKLKQIADGIFKFLFQMEN